MRPAVLSLAGSSRRSSLASDKRQQSPTPSRQFIERKTPLQRRDNNAMMRVPQKSAPLSTRSGNAMPPYEKQNITPRGNLQNLNTASAKPLGTPLTPKVAATAASLTPNPLVRKGTRQDGIATLTISQKDDATKPVVAFMSNNITPRSPKRKSRVESANSTPTHTPSGTPTPDSFRFANDGTLSDIGGLHVTSLESSPLKRPTVSFSPASLEVGSQRSPQPRSDRRFFYANEAHVTVQQPKQQRSAPENKTSSFFYANGESIPTPSASAGSAIGSITGSTMSEDQRQPKFFHANGSHDTASQPAQYDSPAGLSTSKFGFAAPRLVPRHSGSVFSSVERPKSPPKTNKTVPISASRHASPLPSPELPRSQVLEDIPPFKKIDIQTSKRVSRHERAASTGVIDLSLPSLEHSNTVSTSSSPLQPFPLSITTARFVAMPEEIASDNTSGVSISSEIKSPLKAGHSLERMNELAANARRERKVLDLEITNSSLAAINRTLEREMRKQTAELRRYRRLSRSGRLSIATSASMRTSSGTLSLMDGVEGIALSDMSEEDHDDDEQTSDEESVDEGSLSPSAMAESDARHRRKDEKRLQLDLSKHQQLLIDSQNMNQSLKRCLGWTEELINEGKKALAYHVRVSDIELGGRVLAPDELEDTDHDGHLENITNTETEAGETSVTCAEFMTVSARKWP